MELSQYGSGGERFTLGSGADFHVIAHFVEQAPFLKFEASDPTRQEAVDRVAEAALARIEAGDVGGVVWYSSTVAEVGLRIGPMAGLSSLLDRLGRQVRIEGWRRLGTLVLLEFSEEEPEVKPPQAILAPKAKVEVHLAIPGPCPGHFSSSIAEKVIEPVVAIVGFALGRPVELPPHPFPTSSDKVPALEGKRIDPAVHTLARKGVSLDIFSFAPLDFSLFSRMQAALLTYEAAVRQESNPVATVLFVAAAESLTVPNAVWKDQKLTKRFVEFLEELITSQLDEVVRHGNFEEAFGIRRGTRTLRALRRELLKRIYASRSGLLHEGLVPSYAGFGIGQSGVEPVRRGLLAEIAEAAIIESLRRPRSSLIGHPMWNGDADGRI